MFRATFNVFRSRATFSRLLANRALVSRGMRGVGAAVPLVGLAFFNKGAKSGAERDEGPLKRPKTIDHLSLVIQEADLFYDNYMVDNAYNILSSYKNSENPELLWRLARVLCEKGKMSQDPKAKKTYFDEALQMATKALDAGASCFGAHKWYAIILDYVGEIEGNKSRSKKSYEVKTHLERALEINPLDATTWHILGIWHFSFADLSTVSRLTAKAIFGTPPSSTYEEALRHFEKAEAINPNFYSANDYYMGVVHERMGHKDEAVRCFRKAFAAPVVSVDDSETHKKASESLKKYGLV